MKIWIGFNKKWLQALNSLGTYQPVEIQNIFLPCGKDQTESQMQISPISTNRSFPTTRHMGEEAIENIPTLGRAMSWCQGLSSHNASPWAHQWQHRQRISHLFLTSFLKHSLWQPHPQITLPDGSPTYSHPQQRETIPVHDMGECRALLQASHQPSVISCRYLLFAHGI